MKPNENKSIVVADDNPVLRSVLTEIFREAGWAVRTALDGFGALAEICRGGPQILLSDLNMPAMSGFELLSIVRCRFPAIRVIAMSGSYGGREVPHGVAADAFYAKGTSSVATLLELVDGLANNNVYELLRKPAMMWVPRLTFDVSIPESILTTCPQCLRASIHLMPEWGAVEDDSCCRYCLNKYRLCIVKDCRDTDMSALRPSRRPCSVGVKDVASPSSNRCLESAGHP